MDIKFNANGLIPAVIQDITTKTVLMLGYMNEASIKQTEATGKVTFFSRSKQRLWQKGEESGNYLSLVDIKLDCDKDTLLVQVVPNGPTCHKGTDNCWGQSNTTSYGFLSELERTIENRKTQAADSESYVASLFDKGMNKIVQKLGEEAVEVVIEAKDNNDALFLNESADLLFHFLVLLQAKGYKLQDVADILETRHSKK